MEWLFGLSVAAFCNLCKKVNEVSNVRMIDFFSVKSHINVHLQSTFLQRVFLSENYSWFLKLISEVVYIFLVCFVSIWSNL